ncbi:MAG TPA: hypothetical protein VN764_00460 [Polyangiaceae bacterium]|nr:hypothetical protein [Polyangiaceae bacterium]
MFARVWPPRQLPRLIALQLGGLVALASLLVLGCEPAPTQEVPGRVALEFVSAMRRVHGDVEAGKAAYQLMWQPARKNLEERARRASALSGRELHPGELIVPSWFALRLIPESYEERIDGQWAQVTLTDGGGQSSVARLVLEEGKWKVALELPALTAIRSRVDEQ